jgi:hypothetical protein
MCQAFSGALDHLVDGMSEWGLCERDGHAVEPKLTFGSRQAAGVPAHSRWDMEYSEPSRHHTLL